MDWTRTPEALHTAARMVRLLGEAINAVEGQRLSDAETILNEQLVRAELVGTPTPHLVITLDALGRVGEHLRAKPEPRMGSVRAELRQLLGFWTDGWKR